MFGRKRIAELEYQLSCLKQEVEWLREFKYETRNNIRLIHDYLQVYVPEPEPAKLVKKS